METEKNTIRVLMFPWMAYGHISPFVELAKKLTNRNFHIYICSTAPTLSSIKNRVTEKYCLPPHLMKTLWKAFMMSPPNFAKILQTLKPDLVIYDYNMPWAADCASSVNIPAVQFQIFGAAVVAFHIHMAYKHGEMFPFPELHHHLCKYNENLDEALKRSKDIILIKTCKDFEGKYMDYLSSLVSKKVVPVGILVQESTNKDGHEKIMKWLEKKHAGSTVFVSFGSECFLSKEEIHEVAHGLELGQVNFIWAVRFAQGERISIQDVLPEGFLERTKERGMVMEGWAPQALILQHTSIGGFVSHCGWSSCTESMMLGVPIIAMPMKVDQPLNARLVEHIGIGIEAERDENGKLQSEEIAKEIRKVVVEESGEAVRKKSKELSEKMYAKGDEEIDRVVEELMALCNNK